MHQMMISNMLPTIIWNVSITPIKAHYTLFKETLSNFLVRMCGIIGGIFATATIVEALVRNGLCLMLPEGIFEEGDDTPKPTKPKLDDEPAGVEMQNTASVVGGNRVASDNPE